MGASTKMPPAFSTDAPTSRDEEGSIVEQSMKRGFFSLEEERPDERMVP
jgi:hypothetical protein